MASFEGLLFGGSFKQKGFRKLSTKTEEYIHWREGMETQGNKPPATPKPSKRYRPLELV